MLDGEIRSENRASIEGTIEPVLLQLQKRLFWIGLHWPKGVYDLIRIEVLEE
jgi:hypothetical protein